MYKIIGVFFGDARNRKVWRLYCYVKLDWSLGSLRVELSTVIYCRDLRHFVGLMMLMMGMIRPNNPSGRACSGVLP